MAPRGDDPWRPLGLALRAYADGNLDAEVRVLAEEREVDRLAAAYLFRGPEAFPEAESRALSLCRGRVLDAGAGAGSHALELQRRGIEVTALEVSPEAIEVMRARGVRDVRRGDVFRFRDGGFDTVLLLMNGIGLVGTLRGLDRFLVLARRLLAPGGQILVDSADLRESPAPDVQEGIARRQGEGRYFGQVRFRMLFENVRGAAFDWLFVDPARFEAAATARGWRFQVVFHNDQGDYLGRLTRA